MELEDISNVKAWGNNVCSNDVLYDFLLDQPTLVQFTFFLFLVVFSFTFQFNYLGFTLFCLVSIESNSFVFVMVFELFCLCFQCVRQYGCFLFVVFCGKLLKCILVNLIYVVMKVLNRQLALCSEFRDMDEITFLLVIILLGYNELQLDHVSLVLQTDYVY